MTRPAIGGGAVATLALSLALVGMTPLPAAAQSNELVVPGRPIVEEGANWRTVHYGDLDLAGAGGVSELQRRLRRAVADVCGADYSVQRDMNVQIACTQASWARAKGDMQRAIAIAARDPGTRLASASIRVGAAR